ncbi:MAG TPA: LPS export ABC transporter permease LptG [Novimethylophilus sp.]|jgi:lipopolysaccharide export system permease protein|uniref:LPS export ABC transporter permease LptG n=1 Tax=Novimethylophilus sp. TaxID=2137426 RepID=UPI002F40D499
MRIINRYLAQEILSSTLLVTLGLLAMFSFFDLIQELDSLGHGNYHLGMVLFFVLLSAPGHIYEVTPVAVLLGALYSLAQFARHSELVVMRVSGVSRANIGLALLRIGAIFAVLTFLIGELVTPITEKTAQKMRLQAKNDVVAQEFRSGLWVKDGTSFVNIEEVLPDASLHDIHIYEFDPDFRLRVVNNAKSGFYEKERWNLRDVTQTSFAEKKIRIAHYDQAYWQSVIKPELLNVLLVVPEKMAAWNLYFYIKHLSDNHQKTTRQQIALWSKLVYPIACLVMVILALPFGFLQQRTGGIGAKIFAGIMIGISYQVFNRLFVHLGLLNDWAPIVSATLPTLLFLMGGMAMLVWMEKR